MGRSQYIGNNVGKPSDLEIKVVTFSGGSRNTTLDHPTGVAGSLSILNLHSTADAHCGITHEHEIRSRVAFDAACCRGLHSSPGFLELEKGGTAHFWFSTSRSCLSRRLFHFGLSYDGNSRQIRVAGASRSIRARNRRTNEGTLMKPTVKVLILVVRASSLLS